MSNLPVEIIFSLFYWLLKIAWLQAHDHEYLLDINMKWSSNDLSCDAEWVFEFSIWNMFFWLCSYVVTDNFNIRLKAKNSVQQSRNYIFWGLMLAYTWEVNEEWKWRLTYTSEISILALIDVLIWSASKYHNALTP